MLTTTNLEIGIHYWIGAKIEQEGMIAVPAKIFSDFVSSVQDEKMVIRSEKELLYVESENYKTKILGMKTDEFPLIPSLKNAPEFSMPSKELARALSKVLDATSLLETRPELSGVYVNITPEHITFAATDSFRLSEYIVPSKQSLTKAFIVPRTTAFELSRLAASRDEEIRFMVSDGQLAVRASDVELVSRLIDGHYPDYKKVIPGHADATAIVRKQALEQNVRMAGIFSSSISDLSLKAAQGTLHISAKNSDRGEIASKTPLSDSKANFTISVNYRYLLDALKVIDEDEVVINYTGEGSPLVVRGAGNKAHTYVIMPLRS